jgi:hypothetical protein
MVAPMLHTIQLQPPELLQEACFALCSTHTPTSALHPLQLVQIDQQAYGRNLSVSVGLPGRSA